MIPLLILGAIFFYSLANIAIGRASATGNPSFAATVVNLIGTVAPLIAFVAYRSNSQNSVTVHGTMWAVIGGVSIGLFALTITQLFARGSSQSYIFPLVFGAALAIISVIGIVVLREKVNVLSVAGISMIIVGVFLLACGKHQLERGNL